MVDETPDLQASEAPRASSAGFSVSVGNTKIKMPAVLVMTLFAAFGVGGASAVGNYAADTATTDGTAGIEMLLTEQIGETRALRVAVEVANHRNDLRKLEHQGMERSLSRIKARDQARDKVLGLDETLAAFPLSE